MIQQELQDEQNNQNKVDPIKRNNFIFGLLLLFHHLVICPLYGVFCVIPPSGQRIPLFGSIIPIFLVFILFLLLLSFSLIFTYIKKLVWSSLGFNLLITCLTIQVYFLMNAFWTKANITDTNTIKSSQQYFIYLTNLGSQKQTYGATLTQAIQCALANIIAYSAIIGKAGLIQAYFVSFLGTFGFVLNSKIIVLYDWDYGRTSLIFIYGGFMGLFMSLMLLYRYRNQNSTQKHPFYTGNIFQCSLSLMGCLFVTILFPILTIDQQYRKQVDLINPNSLSQSIIIIFFSSFSSFMMSLGVSVLLNDHRVNIRDAVQGSIVGSIACSSASLYINHPIVALAIGSVTGILQTIIQNKIQKIISLRYHIINTFSFFTFGFQGILGSIYTTGVKAFILNHRTQRFNKQVISQPINGLLIGIFSAGFGIAFGAIIGSISLLFANHTKKNHFNDLPYWLYNHKDKFSLEQSQQIKEQTRQIDKFFVIQGQTRQNKTLL